MLIDSKYYQEDLEHVCQYMQFKEGDHVLVTGASGLIGSFLIDALLFYAGKQGIHVDIYAMARNRIRLEERFEAYHTNPNLHLIAADICEPLSTDIKYDYMIHCASNADPGTYARYPVETIETNVIGCKNVLSHAGKDPKTKVLFTSTMEIYGSGCPNAGTKGMTEEEYGAIDPNAIRSSYPESKRLSELMCRSYAEEYGVDVRIARLGYIYGPSMTSSDNKAVAQFIRAAVNQEEICLKSPGQQRRSYCYVADTVAGMMCILFSDCAKAEAYNVANADSTTTIKELAEVAAKTGGRSVKYEEPSDIEKKGFSKTQDAVLDESKLCKLNWKPVYGLEEGIRRTVEILREI